MPITIDRVYELGKLHYERGDFETALKALKEAADFHFRDKNFSQYLDCINIILRIHAERENYDEINKAKELLQDLILKEGFELTSKTYYTLFACAFHKKQFDNALDYAQKALALGLAKDNKEDICHAIFSIAYVYAQPSIGKYSDALKEIYNLQVFFQVYDFPDLKTSVLLLNASILRNLKKYDEAIEIAWKAYDGIKQTKNLMTSTYILGMLGSIYLDQDDKEQARMYFNLALKAVDPKNQKRLYKMLASDLEKMGAVNASASFDLIFSEVDHSITEKKIGKVDFKNQFILMDLLKLFVLNQGAVYTKEYLVEKVWKQNYDPEVHDNKIYVTIKRLRKMIEPDYEKPKYIFRAKNGYYMNKSARVMLLK